MAYSETAAAFTALHVPGDPVVLYNIWDAGSAKAVAKAGAKAIATASWAVAEAQGYRDGENLPLETLLSVVERVTATCDLPVTVDFEAGFAVTPDGVAANVARVVALGAVGINLEDQVIGGDGLYSIADQSARVAAARSTSPDLVINARTDLFLKASDPATHADLVSEALERAAAYAEAGGTCFFVPGISDLDLLAQICADAPLPVNAFMLMLPDVASVAQAGAARCSFGPGAYRTAMAGLTKAAAPLYEIA